jgi:hypothetical protein
MKTWKRSVVLALTTVLTSLISGAMTTGLTQPPEPSAGKTQQNQKAMHTTGEVTVGPHDLLAMAYQANLATFARVIQTQLSQSDTVNVDVARPAAAEMRRSFDQMRQHHRAQMATMRDRTDPPMSAEMQQMENRLTTLGEQLTLLESVVNERTPDPKEVSEYAAAILKDSDGMSMTANPKPRQAMPANGRSRQEK